MTKKSAGQGHDGLGQWHGKIIRPPRDAKLEVSGYRLEAGQNRSYRRPVRFDPTMENGGLPRTVPDARGSKYRLLPWRSDDLLLLRNHLFDATPRPVLTLPLRQAGSVSVSCGDGMRARNTLLWSVEHARSLPLTIPSFSISPTYRLKIRVCVGEMWATQKVNVGQLQDFRGL
jgi:hypothetical protein